MSRSKRQPGLPSVIRLQALTQLTLSNPGRAFRGPATRASSPESKDHEPPPLQRLGETIANDVTVSFLKKKKLELNAYETIASNGLRRSEGMTSFSFSLSLLYLVVEMKTPLSVRPPA